MSKIARFNENLKEILEKEQEKTNPGMYLKDENILLASLLKTNAWKGVEYIRIECQKGFKPVGRNIRVDDGNCPIYIVVGASDISVEADADIIEWNMEAMSFLRNLTQRLTVIMRDVSFKKINRLDFMFYGSTRIKEVGFFNCVDTENIVSANKMFFNCKGIFTISFNDFKIEACEDVSYMFFGCENLKHINDMPKLKNIKNTASMFATCRHLTQLDLSGWDVSKIKTARCMFEYCINLDSLNLYGWNPASLTYAEKMFKNCEKLTSLDLSSWDTKLMKDTSEMFMGCKNITAINLYGWKTSKVNRMDMMFESCEKLEKVNISTFTTSAVSNMNGMFMECKSLKAINLSHFSMGKCRHLRKMFSGCESLVSADISGWKLSKDCDTLDFFKGCNSLVFADTSVLN